MLSDMSDLQQDVIDVIARRTTPKIIQITSEVTHHLTREQNASLTQML